VFTANGAGAGTGTVYPVSYTDTAIGAGSAFLEIDTSSWPDTVPLSNTTSLSIRVFDATTTVDLDSSDELSDIITVNIDVDNIDDIDPESRLYQLTADDVAVDGSDNPLGHIEPWNQSPFSNQDAGFDKVNEVFGNDADVSGSILLRGRSTDNQRIKDISLWIDLDGDNAVDAGEEEIVALFDEVTDNILKPETNSLGTFIVDSQTITEATGHEVDWSFQWDSADVAGVARGNVRFRVTARDFGPGLGNSSAQWPSTDPADTDSIVGEPTILKVDVVPYITGIVNSSNLYGVANDVIRSSTGKYALDRSTVGANRFYINGFNFEDTTLDVRISGSPITLDTDGTSIVNQKAVAASSTRVEMNKDFGISGYLTVFVNSIPTTNNVNNNDLVQNDEYQPVLPRSRQWSDDRYMHVWENTQMLTGDTNSTFYYPSMIMDGNQPVFSYTNDNEGSNRRTTSDTTSARRGYLWYERQTAMARDDSGNYYIVSAQDAFSGGSIGFLYLNRDRDRQAAYGTSGGNHVELVGEDYISRQLNRFRYPQLIVDGPETAARTYVTVYDAHPDEKDLKFFAFEMQGTTATNLNEPAGDANIAGNGWISIPGTQDGASSEYFDMTMIGNATDPGHKMVVTYYDETDASLKIKFAINPVDGNGLYNPATTWYELSVEATNSYAGTYVSATNDGTNVYLAYHDSANADLKVAKIPGTLLVASGGTGTIETYIVDAYLSTGTWTNIVMIDGVPYVSYFSGSYNGTKSPIRMAFPLTSTVALNDGVLTDGSNEYSGDWEVMSVPTVSVPKGGMAQFNRTQIDMYTNGVNLPVIGWLADRLEYGKLAPEGP
jgi:hypothetical protein